MVEIAVIGAGAAGLVASRHLVRCGLRPCIFESSTQVQGVGGAWNSAGMGYKMWDNLTPNLSKHTCVFSDFLWPADTPTFPQRVDMQNYLDRYATTFLDPTCFRYGCTVTNVKRCSPSSSSNSENFNDAFQKQQFQVEWAEEGGEQKSREFDGVIVATGFFSVPFLPDGLLGVTDNIIHSSSYRSPYDFTNKTVAVAGASFSALEIAADVRKQASKVVSILPRIPYVLPRYVPNPQSNDNNIDGAVGFSPLDAVFYHRSRDAPQIPAAIEMTEDDAAKKHAFLRKITGPRKQRDSPLGLPLDDTAPPLVAISDDYLNLAIDGNIDVAHGRVASVVANDDTTTAGDASSTLNIKLENGTTIAKVDNIIACTGYQSQLDFLEPDILKTLEYDQVDRYAPLTLCYDTFHPELPGLGFVGMYKGPYFGVMDLQARLLAGMFSGEAKPTDESISEALNESTNIRKSSALRGAQFPRYDYIGFMDSIANQLDLVPSGAFGLKGTVVSPPFYQPSEEIASKCEAALDEDLHKTANDGGVGGGSANMARVALSALIGKWDFRRTITQFNTPSVGPQQVTGVIDFSHILPPRKDQEPQVKQEWNSVLYNENGIFHVAGKDLEVFRQYEYVYKDDGILEIYFVELGERAHLFLSLKFSKKEDGYWIATNDHLCIKDLYSATFKIAFDGISAREVIMTYRVQGPSKDYESVTHLLPH